MHNDLLHTPDQHIRSTQIDKYVGHTKRIRMVNLPVNRKPKNICLKSKNAWQNK